MSINVLVQVSGGSAAMEPAALDTSLQFLQDAGIKPTHLVTDRSTTVRTLMASKYPEIVHQFDVWHFVKNIRKALWKATKLKSCGADVSLWLQSICNMVWHSIGTSLGEAPNHETG